MSIAIKELDEAIRRNLYNPQNIFRDSMRIFAEADNGEMTAVSATTPFANMMAYIGTQSAINNDQVERAARRMLPEYATTIAELAPHFDYNELQTIHATPSFTTVNLILPVDELLQHAKRNTDGTKQVIIPKDAIFTYTDGTKFALHHSVMIRIVDRDAMDVYYINNDNPLMKIDTPIINYVKDYRKDSEFHVTEIIRIPIKVYQFSSRTEYRSVSVSSGFKEEFTINDQLYHVRVFTTVKGKTVEFLTAHGDFKYNPNSEVPIIVMQHLTDSRIRLKIPDVFIEEGSVGSEITIQILETKGDLELDMLNDGTFNFIPEFINTDATIETSVNALRRIINVGAYSATDPAGGLNIPTLDELRKRVISGNTDNDALTEDQLRNGLAEAGYYLGHELNYIGTNVYTATRKLNDYTGGAIPTSIGGSNLSMVMNNLKDKKGVIFPDKGKTVITPDAIISGTSIRPEFMTYVEAQNLGNLDTGDIVNKVNGESILSPIFYYLLDTTSECPQYGAFDLDNPEIHTPSYMASNPNNFIKMATKDIYIQKVKGSYYIHILTEGNDSSLELADNDITLQLSTTDALGSVFSINADLMSRDKKGNYLFRAELQTGFNVGMKGTIEVTNFHNTIYDSYHMPLESVFSINYIVTNNKYITDDNLIQDNITKSNLPLRFSVVTREQTVVKIGEYLSDLFTPIKSTTNGKSFQTHANDVPKYWETTQFKLDDSGTREIFPNPDYDPNKETGPDNQPILFKVIHNIGDPVINPATNEPEYVARAGDVVRDSNGEPIPIDTKDFNHLVNIQAMDYKFKMINYLPMIQQEVKMNLKSDIAPFAGKMIPDTELQYTLSNTVGDMEVVIDGSTNSTISNEITMRISVKVSETTYKDAKLRKNITNLIKAEVAKHLSGTAYTENTLVEAIHKVIAASVVSFKIDSISTLGGAQSFQLVNSTDNMGIKSVLAISDTGEYEILDGIEVGFISL